MGQEDDYDESDGGGLCEGGDQCGSGWECGHFVDGRAYYQVVLHERGGEGGTGGVFGGEGSAV